MQTMSDVSLDFFQRFLFIFNFFIYSKIFFVSEKTLDEF